MKKIQRHLGEHLKPVKLYYDDILEIIEVLNEGGGEVEIEADDYKIDSPEEILSIKKPFITNLEIRHLNPRVSINFKNSQIWLYASEDTPIQRGLFDKVKTIVKSRQRPLATIIQSPVCSGLYTGASLWFILGFPLLTEMSNILSVAIGLLMLVSGIVWMVVGHKNQFKYFSIIIPSKRKESSNFWQRNKDQIFVALITAVLSIIGTIVVTNYFGKNP